LFCVALYADTVLRTKTQTRACVWDLPAYIDRAGRQGRSSLRVAAASVSVGSSTTDASRPWRTWASADDRFHTRASLIRADSDTATLKTADGRTIQVPLSRLSATDQQYVRDHSR
jgi:hypothetical protein